MGWLREAKKEVIEVRYEDGGPWYRRPESIKEAFESGLELEVVLTEEGKRNWFLSTDLQGQTVVIGDEDYVIPRGQ